MDILEKARELGEMLAGSDELKRMKSAEEAKNADSEAVAALEDYNRMANDFAAKIRESEPTQEELEMYRNTLGEAFQKLDANSVVHEFIESKKAFDDLMKNINSIIALYIMPKGEGSCGGDCGSCGGCH